MCWDELRTSKLERIQNDTTKKRMGMKETIGYHIMEMTHLKSRGTEEVIK